MIDSDGSQKGVFQTDVAINLSFGNEGFGLTIDRLLKLKFFKARAQAPIFSDN